MASIFFRQPDFLGQEQFFLIHPAPIAYDRELSCLLFHLDFNELGRGVRVNLVLDVLSDRRQRHSIKSRRNRFEEEHPDVFGPVRHWLILGHGNPINECRISRGSLKGSSDLPESASSGSQSARGLAPVCGTSDSALEKRLKYRTMDAGWRG